MSHLDRFVTAQHEVFERALSEIREGRKQSHWMWFIFPQLKGLGRSDKARHYGIASLDEAKAYLAHPILGRRLSQAVETLQSVDAGHTAERVFGPVDAMKLRSSLTLFSEAGAGATFDAVLARWFSGEKDPVTLRLLNVD